jgi:hypothetical protein
MASRGVSNMPGLKKRTCLAVAAALLSPALLAGCNEDDYLARRDTVSLGAGDAKEVNAVTHTIDPWSPNARNTEIHQEGDRAAVAIQRYQQNKSIPPVGPNTTTISGQAGPGSQASAQIKN